MIDTALLRDVQRLQTRVAGLAQQLVAHQKILERLSAREETTAEAIIQMFRGRGSFRQWWDNDIAAESRADIKAKIASLVSQKVTESEHGEVQPFGDRVLLNLNPSYLIQADGSYRALSSDEAVEALANEMKSRTPEWVASYVENGETKSCSSPKEGVIRAFLKKHPEGKLYYGHILLFAVDSTAKSCC